MRRCLVLATLALGACDGGGSPRAGTSVHVDIPASASDTRLTVVDPAPDGLLARPRLDAVTGICMGRWKSASASGPAVSVDRDGTYAISGPSASTGSWSVQSQDIVMGEAIMRDCGRVKAHVAVGGRTYSLRRQP